MQLCLDPREEALDVLHSSTAIYTVGEIVDSILDRINWPDRGGRLLDPSAGDGSFLVRALNRIPTPPGDFASVHRVHGWEIYPAAVECAVERISDLLVDRGWNHWEAREAAASVVDTGDFLVDAEIESGEFETIAGNPPYLRFEGLPDFFKTLYSEKAVDYARADLLHAFLDRCSDLLPPCGVIAFVSADRWLFNATAAKLRAAIGSRVGLAHVSRLDPQTSFYRAKYRKAGSPPRIHPVLVVLSPASRDTNPITSGAISPDEGTSADAPSIGPVLSDIANVRIAPWLGPIGIFVVRDSVANAISDALSIPAVDTDDIDSLTDELKKPTRRAFLTKRDSEPSGELRRHLIANKHLLPKKCAGKAYWMPPEPITLDTSKPALLIPRIAKRIRAIRLPAGILPINHNLQVVAGNGQADLDYIERILTSPESQAWIQRHAPRLENGYLSITTTLLRRLPLPSDFENEVP